MTLPYTSQFLQITHLRWQLSPKIIQCEHATSARASMGREGRRFSDFRVRLPVIPPPRIKQVSLLRSRLDYGLADCVCVVTTTGISLLTHSRRT